MIQPSCNQQYASVHWPLAEFCSAGKVGKNLRELRFMSMRVLGWKDLSDFGKQGSIISFIVIPEIFCQKEAISSRRGSNDLEHSTMPMAALGP